jgi:hypothetical protein
MSHPLKQRIDRLRSRVRLLLALYGLSWIVGGSLLAAMVLGVADYLVRYQDPGIRLISSLACLAIIVWTGYRFLYRPLAKRLGDVELAQRLERRFPALADSLASAVEFLDQSEDDPLAGSLTLRRAVIVKTTADTESLDFDQALQRRPVQRAVLWAVGIGLAALILAAADPLAVKIAVARLANPFGKTTWPQTTHLALRQRVERVARGQAFEIEVVDQQGAQLPQDARISYRFQDANGRPIEETEAMHVLGDALVARRENVVRPFSYRVEGGDDRSMSWIPVAVVEPPAVESLALTLIPPAYSGWPTEKAAGHVRALVGTQVRVSGRSTKPLSAAALHLEDGRQIRGRVEADRRSFTIPAPPDEAWLVEKSGAYWFKLTDVENLSSGNDLRWELRAVPDNPPSVTIEQPTATVFVTPEAVVPLKIVAKDDLAVARIELRVTRSDRKESEPRLPLYAGSPHAQPQPSGLSAGAEAGESRRIDYLWSLASLKLAPGTQVTFEAVAADYKPQTGKSEPRRLAVITREELADRIASRQASILAELARVLEMQRQSRQQVSALEIRLGEIGQLDQLDLDHLRGAELNQRQIQRTLTSRSEGVPLHILGLLADLENNKVDSPDVQRRMQGLLEEIDRLDRDHLPAIARELTAAIKSTQNRLQDQPLSKGEGRAEGKHAAARPLLASAGKHQDEVIASLEQMLGQLSRWDNYRRFHRDLTQLQRNQEELNRRATELARRTLGKEIQDLLPQELADLKVAAQGQLELARQLDRILQGMDEAVSQLRESDPLASETVADALSRARELAISAAMRSAGDGTEQNRMGEVTHRQKQVVQDLQEVLDILANRRESELTRLTKKLREAQRDLNDLAQREEALQGQMDQAAQQPDAQQREQLQRLGAEQEKLREETERIGRRLERLTANRPADQARLAAEKMGQASQSAKQGSGKAASFQAHQAKEALREAARQLAQQQRQNDVELMMEQLAQLRDTLQAIHTRQTEAIHETQRLDQLRQQGELSRAQAASLHDLTRQQKSLQTETQGLAGDLAAAEVFSLVLGAAAGDMGRAAARLDRQSTDAATQQIQQNVLAQLDQVLEALKQEEPEPGNSKSGAGQGGKGQPPRGQAIRDYAQLKLLRLLQAGLNRRTQQVDQAAASKSLSGDESRRQRAELSQEQGRLATVLMGLVAPEEESQDNVDLPSRGKPEQDQDDSSLLPERKEMP